MAQPDREQVYQALFTLLNDALGPAGSTPTFQACSRRIVQLDGTPPANLPALYQSQVDEPRQPVKGIPALRIFKAELTVYVDFGEGTDAVPSTNMNALVTAIENTLLPNPVSAFQQLGVPVSSVLIGSIKYWEGVLGVLMVAVIPVEIVANY
jgi:hypothetical protein